MNSDELKSIVRFSADQFGTAIQETRRRVRALSPAAAPLSNLSTSRNATPAPSRRDGQRLRSISFASTPARGDDGRDRRIAASSRAPSRMRSEAATICGRIAGPASGISTLKSTPETRFTVSMTSQHRIAVPVAAVERRVGAAAPQIARAQRVRARQIADMDVVADAGAVRRRIVGAEHVHLVAPAECGLDRDLDQMRRALRRLAGAHFRVGARHVEVAQDDEAQSMRRAASRSMISVISFDVP